MTVKTAAVFALATVLCVGMVSLTLWKTNAATINWEKEKMSAAEGAARYDLREFKHGDIAGVALLDKQIGRVWLLTQLERGGKRIRDQFREIGVEGLWQTDDEFWETAQGIEDFAKGEEGKKNAEKMMMEEYETLLDVRSDTRPKAILEAEKQSRRLRHPRTPEQARAAPSRLKRESPQH